MNKENNKLGNGARAPYLTLTIKTKAATNKIDISKIYPNKKQPRKNFEEKEIKELSESIKNQGLIQPIVVRETSGTCMKL
jgi:ParB family chromosome partitioning protein